MNTIHILPEAFIVQVAYQKDIVATWLTLQSSIVGNETKSGMSRGTAEPKLTAADAMIDKLTIAIFLLQIVAVLVLGYFGNIWKDTQGLKVLILFYKQYPGATNSF
jgi:hypothetical protein